MKPHWLQGRPDLIGRYAIIFGCVSATIESLKLICRPSSRRIDLGRISIDGKMAIVLRLVVHFSFNYIYALKLLQILSNT